MHSAVNFLPLATFFRKLRFFFEKHIQVLSKEQPIFERFEKSYSFSRNFRAYLLPLATFQKNILFSKEPSFFFKKKHQLFERFEVFYYFNRIVVKICYLLRFFVKITVFSKNPSFFQKKPFFERFEKSYSFSRNFRAYLLPLATFQKNKKIFSFRRNPASFLKKTSTFWTVWSFLLF